MRMVKTRVGHLLFLSPHDVPADHLDWGLVLAIGRAARRGQVAFKGLVTIIRTRRGVDMKMRVSRAQFAAELLLPGFFNDAE